MNPVLRVSDETFERLKAFAEPLEDTADDALRRVLDLAERRVTEPKGSKGAKGAGLPPPTAKGGRRERTAHVLERCGVLVPGAELVLMLDRLPPMTGADPDDLFRAIVSERPRARQNVIWSFDERRYSLSTLSEQLREEYSVPLPEGGLNGYLHWALASDRSRSLWEIAEEIRERNERAAAATVEQGGGP